MSELTISMNVESKRQVPGRMRFWQSFNHNDALVMMYRSEHAYWLARGIPEQAMGLGFDLVDEEGEVLDGDNSVWEQMEKLGLVEDAFKCIQFSRAQGKNLAAFYEDANTEAPKLRSFLLGAITETRESGTGKITKLTVTQEWQGASVNKDIELDKEDHYWLIYEEKEVIDTGMSVFEPCWDTLLSLIFGSGEAAMSRDIRFGGGNTQVRAPQALINDPKWRGETGQGLMEHGCGTNTIFLGFDDPTNPDGGVTIDYGDAPTHDFEYNRKRAWMNFAIYVATSQADMEGINPGQLAGADMQEKIRHKMHQKQRKKYENFWRWNVERSRDNEKLEAPVEFHGFKWREAEAVDVKEQLVLLQMQVNLYDRLVQLGFPADVVAALVGLPLDTSQQKSIEPKSDVDEDEENTGDSKEQLDTNSQKDDKDEKE